MTTFQLLSILITIAALFGWVSTRWLKLPITIGTMLLTVMGSVALLWTSAFELGLRPWAIALVRQINFEELILHAMLAILLFGGAFLLDIEWLAREKAVVATLSIVGTLLSTVSVAGLMRLGLPVLGIHTTWLECLFFGALISPTDPIAVMEMLRRIGVSKSIQAQLAGESLFNDGIGAGIFLALLEVARGGSLSILHVGKFFLLQAGGGLAMGVAGAALVSFLLLRVNAYQVEVLLTLALALGGYALADKLGLSAPLEAVAAAIALRYFDSRRTEHQTVHDRVDRFWEVVDEIQNSLLFLLLGLEVLAIPLREASIGSGIWAIVVVMGVRFGVVSLVERVFRACRSEKLSSVLALSWGGLRGGLSIALALSVPENEGRSWILATTYIVVVFSILVQGGSMGQFLRHLNIASEPQATGE